MRWLPSRWALGRHAGCCTGEPRGIESSPPLRAPRCAKARAAGPGGAAYRIVDTGAAACSRAGIDVQGRDARQGGRLHLLGGADHRSGSGHLGVLAGAHPAREGRRAEAPSAGQGDPGLVPAVAGVRRHVVAGRVAVGLQQACAAQDGLRHRRRRFAWATPRRRRSSPMERYRCSAPRPRCPPRRERPSKEADAWTSSCC